MTDPEFDPSTERADEVEDYTGEVPRVPVRSGAGTSPDGSTGFGDGDVADVDTADTETGDRETGDRETGDSDTAPADGSNSEVFLDVDALLAERDQLKDVAMRVQADFENYRKRIAAQHVADVDRATGRLAEALLPVLDAAEAAYVQHPDEVGPLLSVLLSELRKHGLETLELNGQPFDPEVADAVAHQPGDGGPAVVAEVLRSGYRWRGKTLRPAMVRTTD
jgi:molecular chaperone GrpE